MKKIFSIVVKGLFAVVALLMTLWAVGAIYYSNLPWPLARAAAAIAFPVACVVVFFAVKPFRTAFLVFLTLFAAVLVWWLLIPPSNSRNWQPDVAIPPLATFDHNMVTVHHIRNCDYRSETDYTASY
jgi:hypothetical protein